MGGWNVYDKVEEEERQQRMVQLNANLEAALNPTPAPLVVTREMRQAVIGEILEHVKAHVPGQYDWIVKMTLLDYGCRALIAEPDEDEPEVSFEPTWDNQGD